MVGGCIFDWVEIAADGGSSPPVRACCAHGLASPRAECPQYVGGMSVAGFCADEGGEEDVSEPVDAEAGQVIIGEIELEAAFEIMDASGQLVSVEGCD